MHGAFPDGGDGGIEPFALDPTFDYEHVVLTGQKFSMRLAMERGEFYDRGV